MSIRSSEQATALSWRQILPLAKLKPAGTALALLRKCLQIEGAPPQRAPPQLQLVGFSLASSYVKAAHFDLPLYETKKKKNDIMVAIVRTVLVMLVSTVYLLAATSSY